MAKKPFSIDDAFDENLDDVVVRVYGSTTVEKPAYSARTNVNNRPSSDMTSTPSHGINPQNPVLLSIRTGIMPDDTASKDSDSLIHENHHQYSQSYFDPDRIWFKHPRVKENWKVVAAAFALVVIGLGLFVTGIAVLIIPLGGVQGLVFLITGVICFIPGAYHVVYIYLAVKGRKGYDFYHLPLFN